VLFTQKIDGIPTSFGIPTAFRCKHQIHSPEDTNVVIPATINNVIPPKGGNPVNSLPNADLAVLSTQYLPCSVHVLTGSFHWLENVSPCTVYYSWIPAFAGLTLLMLNAVVVPNAVVMPSILRTKRTIDTRL